MKCNCCAAAGVSVSSLLDRCLDRARGLADFLRRGVSVSSLLDRCLDQPWRVDCLTWWRVSVSSLLDRCLDRLDRLRLGRRRTSFSILAVGSLPRPSDYAVRPAQVFCFSILAVGSLPRPEKLACCATCRNRFSILAVGSLPRPSSGIRALVRAITFQYPRCWIVA